MPRFEVLWSVPLTGLLLVTLSGAAAAQEAASEGPWFGLPLPPPFEPHDVPALIGDRGPAPAVVPPGEEGHRNLEGARIRTDLETIVGFSRQSRQSREIGEGQLWGRITGFPSSTRTIEWAVEQYRDAGIDDVEIQRFEQDEEASFWLPLSWEVRLLGDPVFGEGSRDVVLETAMPLAPSEIPAGGLTAPLVYVGTARPAELAEIDVRGKVAVQHVTPQGHTVFERSSATPRARALMDRGAVAVFNVVALPGNERSRDFSNCGGPCFNLGGRGGHFLESVMDRAADSGTLDQLRVQIRLETERRTGLSGENGVAIVPGRGGSGENVIVNAHADAWFDGAGDNGDGLAVQVALARHFARPENRLDRTLVFVASAGHHSPGLRGPSRFVEMNPELTDGTVLVLNIEHVAQRNLSPARSLSEDGYREFVADVGEAPIVAGIPDPAPVLERIIADGVERYGTNFVSSSFTGACGDCGGYRPLGTALVTTMQAPPLYHTSGEVAEAISTPGLERIARFLAHFLREIDGIPAGDLHP